MINLDRLTFLHCSIHYALGIKCSLCDCWMVRMLQLRSLLSTFFCYTRARASTVHDLISLVGAPLLSAHDGATLVEFTGLFGLGADFAGDSTRAELVCATTRALATMLTVMVELRGRLTGAGVAEMVMDVLGGGTGEGVGGGGARGVRVAVEDGARVGGGGELDGLAGRARGLDALGGGVGVRHFVDLAVLELVCWVGWVSSL